MPASLKFYDLPTDDGRTWEELQYKGVRLTIIRNDLSDLEIMIDRKGGADDQIPIPEIAFGTHAVSILTEGFEKIYMNHAASSGEHIFIVVEQQKSCYLLW